MLELFLLSVSYKNRSISYNFTVAATSAKVKCTKHILIFAKAIIYLSHCPQTKTSYINDVLKIQVTQWPEHWPQKWPNYTV